MWTFSGYTLSGANAADYTLTSAYEYHRQHHRREQRSITPY